MKITVMIATIIFCVLWLCAPWQWSHSHLQSRSTKYHDRHNISPENTNSHGSTQCGINSACANSGANKLIIDSTIGNTQQNKCGNKLAIIPILIALFFISNPGCGVRLSPAVRTFATCSISVGVPNRNRTCIKGLGNPRSIQLNYGDNALYFIHRF